MIGLAAIAALALTALAGISSAFANETVLCKTSASTCPVAERYSSGTSLKASSSSLVFETGMGDIECAEPTLEGKSTAASGEPLPVEVTAWTLKGPCVNYEEKCEVESENLPISASIAWSGGSNGTMTGSEVGWHAECESGLDCTYSVKPMFTVEKGSPAHLTMAAQTGSESGPWCGLSGPAKIPATSYTVSSPKPLYVGVLPSDVTTKLCKENITPCPEKAVYPAHTKLSAELLSGKTAVIETGFFGPITCKISTLSGETTAESGKPLSATVAGPILQSCENDWFGACIFEAEGSPYSTGFEAADTGLKTMSISNLKERVLCEVALGDCTFSATKAEFSVSNGSPATLQISQELSRSALPGGWCPNASYFTAKYKITSPTSVYVIRNE
jgi:hypothetical protein